MKATDQPAGPTAGSEDAFSTPADEVNVRAFLTAAGGGGLSAGEAAEVLANPICRSVLRHGMRRGLGARQVGQEILRRWPDAKVQQEREVAALQEHVEQRRGFDTYEEGFEALDSRADTGYPILARVLPEFAAELRRALEDSGFADLAKQVPTLSIVDRCRCGEKGCATFHTVARPWPNPQRTEYLGPAANGMVLVHHASGEIVEIEVLDREDVSAALDTLLQR